MGLGKVLAKPSGAEEVRCWDMGQLWLLIEWEHVTE